MRLTYGISKSLPGDSRLNYAPEQNSKLTFRKATLMVLFKEVRISVVDYPSIHFKYEQGVFGREVIHNDRRFEDQKFQSVWRRPQSFPHHAKKTNITFYPSRNRLARGAHWHQSHTWKQLRSGVSVFHSGVLVAGEYGRSHSSPLWCQQLKITAIRRVTPSIHRVSHRVNIFARAICAKFAQLIKRFD